MALRLYRFSRKTAYTFSHWIPKCLPGFLGRQLSYHSLARWSGLNTQHCSVLSTPQTRFLSLEKLSARNFTSATSWKMLSYAYCSTNRSMTYNPNIMTSVPCACGAQMQVRTVTRCSKNKGKRKTVKAVAKRFIRTGSGKLKYWPPGNVHNMLSKSRKKRLQLRKAKYVTKTQLKTLNKMISGW